MLEQWLPTLIAIFGSLISGYLGVRVGLVRMEERHLALSQRFEEHVRNMNDRMKVLGDRSHDYNDALLVHDGEIAEVMRKLDMDRMPRRRRRERDE